MWFMLIYAHNAGDVQERERVIAIVNILNISYFLDTSNINQIDTSFEQ